MVVNIQHSSFRCNITQVVVAVVVVVVVVAVVVSLRKVDARLTIDQLEIDDTCNDRMHVYVPIRVCTYVYKRFTLCQK